MPQDSSQPDDLAITEFLAQKRCSNCFARLVAGGCANAGCPRDIRRRMQPRWYENRSVFEARRERLVRELKRERDAPFSPVR